MGMENSTGALAPSTRVTTAKISNMDMEKCTGLKEASIEASGLKDFNRA